MKQGALGMVVASLFTAVMVAQTVSGGNLPGRGMKTKPVAKQLVSERGPHWQTVQNLVPVADTQGEWSYQTNSYVHLEPGLNYQTARGDWAEATEEFELVPEGAVARHGQHQVTLPGNLNGPQPVTLLQPDGQTVTSRPHGLAYFDTATGQAVLLAEIKDCAGFQVAPNQILYTDAFDDIQADVRYTYTKGGFEQDIVLKQAPPAPEKYGLNSATTRLEVWSEFLSAPEPRKEARVLNPHAVAAGQAAFGDDQLDFGAMKMGAGRAFQAGNQDESAVPVGKQWLKDQGRTFLIEAVELPSVSADLQVLPQIPGGGSLRRKAAKRETVLHALPAKAKETKREQATIRPATKELLMALIGPALVLDYSTLSLGNITNQIFKGDTTYYVAGALTALGTSTTFEAGTVLKFTNTAALTLTVKTPLKWQGSLYRPVVFTAKDDNSVGETITGSSGSPSGYYATTALSLDGSTGGANTSFTLAHLRVAYAQTAVELNQQTGHVLSHLQVVNCGTALAPGSANFSLRNVLVTNVTSVFSGTGSTGAVQHLTVNGAGTFAVSGTFTAANLQVLNTLLVAVVNSPAGTYTGGSDVVVLANATGVFQNVLAGGHYLAPGSPYRNVGSTAINAGLAADFRGMSTYPPTTLGSAITTATVLAPAVARDTDTPDLGYHYPVLDFLVSGVSITGTTLTLTNGVALGVYGTNGFTLQNNATILSTGTPKQPNRLVRYHAVQEQPVLFNGAGTALLGLASLQTTRPVLRFRFTDLPALAGSTANRDLLNATVHFLAEASFTDCSFRGSRFSLTEGTGGGTGYAVLVALTNNVAERATLYLSKYYYSVDVNFTANLFNNLFWGGTVTLNYDTSGYNNPAWTVKDNHFDTVSLTSRGTGTGTITKANNAYQSTTSLGGSGNVTLTAFPFATAANGLGPWYHGATTPVDVGSRTAAAAALYHHTTQTGQAKEAGTTVDIGFHYVAVDGNGNPLDYDGDGVADYLEDTNRDGVPNTPTGTPSGTETDWQVSQNGTTSVPGLQVFSSLE